MRLQRVIHRSTRQRFAPRPPTKHRIKNSVECDWRVRDSSRANSEAERVPNATERKTGRRGVCRQQCVRMPNAGNIIQPYMHECCPPRRHRMPSPRTAPEHDVMGKGGSGHFSASVRARADVRLAACIGRARIGQSAKPGTAPCPMRVCLSESALAPSASSSACPFSPAFPASEGNVHHASTRHQLGEADQRGAEAHNRLPMRIERRGVRLHVLHEQGRLPQRDARTQARDGTALARRVVARGSPGTYA
jgi:hypothetical protein